MLILPHKTVSPNKFSQNIRLWHFPLLPPALYLILELHIAFSSTLHTYFSTNQPIHPSSRPDLKLVSLCLSSQPPFVVHPARSFALNQSPFIITVNFLLSLFLFLSVCCVLQLYQQHWQRCFDVVVACLSSGCMKMVGTEACGVRSRFCFKR